MPATPNIIDQLGTSWKLHVQEFATFSYDHPTFGLLEYTGTEAWLCDNVNTLSLTSQGNLPDGVLPQKVCIRPKYDGKCGCYDTVIYQSASEQCECGDNGCPQTHTLWLRCDDCYENDTQTISRTVPGIGRSCSSPSYSMTSSLCGQTLLVTWYCCGGGWLADVTLNGNFCGTYPVPLLSKCPLVIGVGTSSCDLSYYTDCESTCIGIDEECEPPDPCGECSDPMPGGTLTGDLVVTGCNCLASQTVTFTKVGCEWLANLSVICGGATAKIVCTGGNWVATLHAAYSGSPSEGDLTDTQAGSPGPIDVDFTFSSSDDPAWQGYCDGDVVITLSVTE